MKSDFADLQAACSGRWPDILPNFGIDASLLRRKQGPCPLCGGKGRFRYDDKDGRGTWICNQCGAGDGFTIVAMATNSDRRGAVRAVAELMGMAHKKGEGEQRRARGAQAQGDFKRSNPSKFSRIAEESILLNGSTIACEYLKNRGIKGFEGCDNLAFHPSLPFYNEDGDEVARFPCLIARLENLNRTTVSLHRIYLDPKGKKADVDNPKKTMPPLYEGATMGAAVHLDEPKDGIIAVCEGLETGLYIRQATGLPVWAALTAGSLKELKVPDDIAHVIIFGDNDKSKTGQNAAWDLADKLTKHGKSCQVLLPKKTGNDWLDEGGLEDVAVEDADYYDVTARWPEPEQFGVLPNVKRIDETYLPAVLWAYVLDIAKSLQCPPEFIAVTILSLLSTIIGAACEVKPKRKGSWPNVANLWGAVVSPASIVLKSPAMDKALTFLLKLNKEFTTEHAEQFGQYQKELEMFQVEKAACKSRLQAAIKSGNKLKTEEAKKAFSELVEPAKPDRRVLLTNDATVEKLIEMMAVNPRGLMLYRDELAGLFTSWEREGRQQDKQFFLEAWKGYAGFSQHRIATEREAENCCLTIFGGIQPSVLTKYLYTVMKNGSDGFMARIQLLVYPDVPEWSLYDEYEDVDAKDRVYNICKALAVADFVAMGAEWPDGTKRPFFRFTFEAQELFYKWYADLEKVKLRQVYKDDFFMIEHMGKYRSLVPSLALIFHLVEMAETGRSGSIGLDKLEMAIKWAELLETHANRVYSLVGTRVDFAKRTLMEKIKEGKLGTSFTVRDVTRNGWRGCTENKEVLYDALAALEHHGWLRLEFSPKRVVYFVNPRIFRGDEN